MVRVQTSSHTQAVWFSDDKHNGSAIYLVFSDIWYNADLFCFDLSRFSIYQALSGGENQRLHRLISNIAPFRATLVAFKLCDQLHFSGPYIPKIRFTGAFAAQRTERGRFVSFQECKMLLIYDRNRRSVCNKHIRTTDICLKGSDHRVAKWPAG